MRLIDADKLINELDNDLMGALYMFNTTKYGSHIWHTRMKEIERCIGAVMRQPTAKQPERPKGRWDKPSLHGLNGKLNDLGVICSHCLKYADTDYDFCPNCGADMRGDEE